jgi:hypothetical protein
MIHDSKATRVLGEYVAHVSFGKRISETRSSYTLLWVGRRGDMPSPRIESGQAYWADSYPKEGCEDEEYRVPDIRLQKYERHIRRELGWPSNCASCHQVSSRRKQPNRDGHTMAALEPLRQKVMKKPGLLKVCMESW